MSVAARRMRTIDRRAAAPDAISGLELWLKADAITALNDGDAVATWADSSINARDATQGTAGSRPSYETNELNGLPVLRFDGTADHLRVDAIAPVLSGNDLPMSVICVHKPVDVAGAVYCWFGVGATTGTVQLHAFRITNVSSGRYEVLHRDDANVLVEKNTGAVTGLANAAWHILATVLPGTTVGMWRDGTAVITAGNSLNTGQTTLGQAAVGGYCRNSTPADFFKGDIAELVVYSRALTTAERRQVERHLGAKYAISVT